MRAAVVASNSLARWACWSAAALLMAGCGVPASVSSPDPRPEADGSLAASATAEADGSLTTSATGEWGELAFAPMRLSDEPGIENLIEVFDRVYSGGEPRGEKAFAHLARLGITTVVSVDGAKPDVELARQHGLRYVHVPIGYDGVSKDAGAALARLVRDLEGPFYIHCHHGKHRGPAATAIACVAAGRITNEQALDLLTLAGTGKQYAGLWRDVRSYVPPAADAELPELVESAQIESFAAAMAKIDRNFDNLGYCRDADWNVPSDHPDLVAVQEAVILKEGLREAGRHLDADRGEEFKQWLAECERAAERVESALKSGDTAAAEVYYQGMCVACQKCHDQYRD